MREEDKRSEPWRDSKQQGPWHTSDTSPTHDSAVVQEAHTGEHCEVFTKLSSSAAVHMIVKNVKALDIVILYSVYDS